MKLKKTATEEAFDIAKEITKRMPTQPQEDKQIEASIAPIISNAIYEREKNVKEIERWRTIRVLAINLQEGVFYDIIDSLGFKTTL